MEKETLATINSLKGHLKAIEGLLSGFKKNLRQAFRANAAFGGRIPSIENVRSHDVWKTIAFSVADLCLATVKRFIPSAKPPLTAEKAICSGRVAFYNCLSIR